MAGEAATAHGIGDLAGFLSGLRELAESAFPKQCPSCGRVYETAQDFIAQTQPLRSGASGVKATQDDGGAAMLEIYRNCVCGSTLMDFFSERRDTSDKGLMRRRRFGELHEYLVAQGVEPALARAELLKVMRGQPSELLARMAPPKARAG